MEKRIFLGHSASSHEETFKCTCRTTKTKNETHVAANEPGFVEKKDDSWVVLSTSRLLSERQRWSADTVALSAVLSQTAAHILVQTPGFFLQ